MKLKPIYEKKKKINTKYVEGTIKFAAALPFTVLWPHTHSRRNSCCFFWSSCVDSSLPGSWLAADFGGFLSSSWLPLPPPSSRQPTRTKVQQGGYTGDTNTTCSVNWARHTVGWGSWNWSVECVFLCVCVCASLSLSARRRNSEPKWIIYFLLHVPLATSACVYETNDLIWSKQISRRETSRKLSLSQLTQLCYSGDDE